MKELFVYVDAWLAAGKQVAIARVVGVEGSGPREVGAAMAVNEDGEVAGSVSGGCVEGAVVTEALAVIASGVATRHEFGCSDSDAFAVGLPCGGTLHVLVEPMNW
jgi:xanthine dehydrogenase accessory factor